MSQKAGLGNVIMQVLEGRSDPVSGAILYILVYKKQACTLDPFWDALAELERGRKVVFGDAGWVLSTRPQ